MRPILSEAVAQNSVALKPLPRSAAVVAVFLDDVGDTAKPLWRSAGGVGERPPVGMSSPGHSLLAVGPNAFAGGNDMVTTIFVLPSDPSAD